MNIVFLHEGITPSLIPLLTIIEHHPNCIVGCIIMPTQRVKEETPPGWYMDSCDDKTALALLECVKKKQLYGIMSAFLIIKEPNSFLQLSVLAAIGCFKLNYNSGEGGQGCLKLLEVLAKHNIRTCFPQTSLPLFEYLSESLHERNEQIKAAFEEVFGTVAKQWLPESWGLEPVSYY